ncbi:MAG: peptide chain release factor N(5)-glutamine methyltransferase [Candidatus Omnitrophota bacterium]
MTDDELFLTALRHCSRTALYMNPRDLTEQEKEQLESMRWRRAAGEPVQYICGFTDFMGHRIEVGQGVLVPRPETEILVDAVIAEFKGRVSQGSLLLDIGTGSGCIPVSLVKGVPGCRAIGVDVSPEALLFARRNAGINEVTDRVEFIERDVFWYIDETKDRFDAVISNPPYIPSAMISKLPQDVRQEPWLALDGGADGLHFYRYIVPGALKLLNKGGLLALEFGDGQRKDLENLFAITGGWDKIRFIKDNAGKERVALARKRSDQPLT